jgi:predicted MPP superfamily phosphohydrolase
LGGDLVDRRAGLPLLQRLIQQLLPTAPLWAIAGNHDHWVGVKSVKQTVENASGQYFLDNRPQPDLDVSPLSNLGAVGNR